MWVKFKLLSNAGKWGVGIGALIFLVWIPFLLIGAGLDRLVAPLNVQSVVDEQPKSEIRANIDTSLDPISTPTPTSTPSPTPNPTPTLTPAHSSTPTIKPTPTPIPTKVPTPSARSVATATPKATAAASASCDPNYSGDCVPIDSDVDCQGGSGNGPSYVRGPVTIVGYDIYKLDSDKDGIGCE